MGLEFRVSPLAPKDPKTPLQVLDEWNASTSEIEDEFAKALNEGRATPDQQRTAMDRISLLAFMLGELPGPIGSILIQIVKAASGDLEAIPVRAGERAH